MATIEERIAKGLATAKNTAQTPVEPQRKKTIEERIAAGLATASGKPAPVEAPKTTPREVKHTFVAMPGWRGLLESSSPMNEMTLAADKGKLETLQKQEKEAQAAQAAAQIAASQAVKGVTQVPRTGNPAFNQNPAASMGAYMKATEDLQAAEKRLAAAQEATSAQEAKVAEQERRRTMEKYAMLRAMPDFGEKSKFVPTQTGEVKIYQGVGGGKLYADTSVFGDLQYDYINKSPSAVNAYDQNHENERLVGVDDSWMLTMTEDERAMYNYVYATRGKDGATAYLDFLKPELTARQRAEEEKGVRKLAQEHPVFSSGVSVAMAPMKGLSYIGQITDYAEDGKIDQNAGYNKWPRIPTTIRGQVSQDIETAAGKFWGPVGSFAYQTGMSMGDFLLNAAITGGLSGGVGGLGTEAAKKVSSNLALGIMGAGAAADATVEAKDRGLDDTTAFTLGTIAGAAEIVTEKLSLDALLDGKWEKNALQYVIKNAVTEGSEEVGSDIINATADVLLSKDKSQWRQAVNAYIAQGYDEGEALGLAARDAALEMGMDFLGGALSGGVMAGARVGIGQTGNTMAQNRVALGAEEGRVTPQTAMDRVNERLDQPGQTAIDIQRAQNAAPVEAPVMMPIAEKPAPVMMPIAEKPAPVMMPGAVQVQDQEESGTLQGGLSGDTMGATNISLMEGLEHGEARQEARADFLRRATGSGYSVVEGTTVAYGFRRAGYAVEGGYSRETAPNRAQGELKELGIEVDIIDGPILWNQDGVTRSRDVPEAVTAGRSHIFISKDATVAPRNIAGHEAFHLWQNGVGRDAYIETLEENLLFTSEAFRQFQSTIAEAYLGGEADLTDDAQIRRLREELFAYISGDIHEGVNDERLRPMFRDLDAVKAAWNKLIQENRGKAGDASAQPVPMPVAKRPTPVPMPIAEKPAPVMMPGAVQVQNHGETQKTASTGKTNQETYTVISRLKENISAMSQSEPVAKVSISKVDAAEGTTMAQKAHSLFETIKGIVTRRGFGEVEITDRSAKDDLSHGVGAAKAAVIPAIPSVIEKGIQIDVQNNWKGRAYGGYIFAAPVTMDGRTVYVAAVVKQTSKNRFYLHEVVDSDGNIIKISNGERATQTSLAANGDAGTQSPLPLNTTIPQSGQGVNTEYARSAPADAEGAMTPEEAINALFNKYKGRHQPGAMRERIDAQENWESLMEHEPPETGTRQTWEKEIKKETLRAEREKRSKTELRHKIADHSTKLAKKLLKPTDKLHVPEELKGAVTAVVDAINLESDYAIDAETGKRIRTRDPDADFRTLLTKRTTAFQEMRKALGRLRQTEGAQVVIDPALLGDSAEGFPGMLEEVISWRDTPINRMSTEQLETIWKTLRATENAVFSAGKAFTEGKYAHIAEWAGDLQRSAGRRKNKRNPWGKQYTLDLEDSLTFLHHFGEAGKEVYRMLRDAQDAEEIMVHKVAEEVQKTGIVDKVEELTKEIHTFTTEGGDELTLSADQMMNFYLLTQRSQAHEHLLVGGIVQPEVKAAKVQRGTRAIHLTINDLAEITGALTEAQVGLADKLQAICAGTLAKYGNEASMKVYGYEKFGEAHYWPIKSAREGVYQNVEKGGAQPRSIRNTGMTKNTVPHANNQLEIGSIFDVFADHTSDMIKYAAYLAPMEDAERLYNFRFKGASGEPTGLSVKSLLDEKAGVGGQRYWAQLMEDIQNGINGPGDSPIWDAVGKSIGSFKGAAVGGNLRVVIQQPTAWARAAAVLSPKDMAHGLLKGATEGKGWEKALKWSPTAMRKNDGGFDIGTARQMNELLFGSRDKLRNVTDKFSALAGMADAATWGKLWNACEWAVKRERSDLELGSEAYYKAVERKFRNVIDQTQVMDGVLQRSNIMRSSNGVVKQATSFMGEPIKTINMAMRAYDDWRYETDPGRKAAAARKLGRTVGALVANGVLNALAQSIVDAYRDDDKDKDYWEKFAAAFTGLEGDEEGAGDYLMAWAFNGNLGGGMNPATMIPFVKDIFSIIQGYDVTRQDMELAADVIQAAETMVDTMGGNGKKTMANAVNGLVVNAAKFFGIPAANVERDIYGIVRQVVEATGNVAVQYEIEKVIYNIGSEKNKSRFEDLMYTALEQGDTEVYNHIRAELMEKMGLAGDDIDTAMKGRYKKAREEDEDYTLSPEAEALIGYHGTAAKSGEGFTAGDLDAKAYQIYADRRSTLYQELSGGLTAKEGDEGWADGLNKAYELAHKLALAEASDGKYELDGWVAKGKEAQKKGIKLGEYLNFYIFCCAAESDKDKDGKTVAGSKREKVWKYINGLKLSRAQKDFLHLCQYSEGTLEDAPWRR